MSTLIVRNNPSHVLTKKDNNLVTGILGQDRISMCTTYVQIYTASEEEQNWLIEGTGPLCLVHDFQQNTFVLVLIDASCDMVVWERELTHFTEYLSVSGKFHLLRFDELIGINFLCSLEARHFAFKLVEVSKYIKLTCLGCVTGHNNNNSIDRNKKTEVKSRTSQNKNTEKKPKKKDSSIKFRISYITQYYHKITQRNMSYQILESDTNSLPTSPIKDACTKSLTFTRSNSFNCMDNIII